MSLDRSTREALEDCTNDVQRRFVDCGIAAHTYRGIVVLAFWGRRYARHFAKCIRGMSPKAHYFSVSASVNRKIANEAVEAMHKKLGRFAPDMLPEPRARASSQRGRRARRKGRA